MRLTLEYVALMLCYFSKISLRYMAMGCIVRATCKKVIVRCIRSMHVLDPIEPSGIVKVASIVMPHSLAGVEDLE